MKIKTLLVLFLLVFSELKGQITVENNSDYLLGLPIESKIEKNVFSFEFNAVSNEITLFKLDDKQKISNLRLLVWSSKIGLLKSFNQIQFSNNKIRVHLAELADIKDRKAVFVSLVSDSLVLQTIPFEKWKILDPTKSNDILNVKPNFKFALHDNFRSNKDLGSINDKIQLGETFALKFGVKSKDTSDLQYKIWFNSDHPSLRCQTDTLRKKGKQIIDSAIFLAPFQYPKYGRTVTITIYYFDFKYLSIDSSKVVFDYDKLIPLNLTRENFQYELFGAQEPDGNDVNSEKKPSFQKSKVLVFQDENISVFILNNELIEYKLFKNVSNYSSIVSLIVRNSSDSILWTLNDKKTENLDLPKIFSLNPSQFKISYTINHRFPASYNLGILCNPIEFTNSSNLGVPIGLSFGYKRKNGIKVYFLSNYSSLKPNYSFENALVGFPEVDFNKNYYSSMNEYKYQLNEIGLLHELYVTKGVWFQYGARFSSFRYATLVKNTDMISNTETIEMIELTDENYKSVDPIVGVNFALNKNINFNFITGTRNLSTDFLSINMGLNFKIK